MKAKPGWIDSWNVSEQDESMSLVKLVVNLLVYLLIVGAFLGDILLVYFGSR